MSHYYSPSYHWAQNSYFQFCGPTFVSCSRPTKVFYCKLDATVSVSRRWGAESAGHSLPADTIIVKTDSGLTWLKRTLCHQSCK